MKGPDVFGLVAVVSLVVFAVTATVMQLAIEKWHERTCVEQLKQATTASDTLSVVRLDSWCNYRVLADD